MGARVNVCAAGGVGGEGGMGVSVDEVGAGLWLMVKVGGSAVVAVVVAGGVGASDVVDTDGEGDGW